MAPRKRCSTCGSRQWRKNTTGLVTCSEGHVLQHYIHESEDIDDMATYMMKKRALKSSRMKQGKASRADPRFYHGDRARFHYYQCLQLLLRKQVAALIALWKLPTEFETICRDLWALYLDLLPSPPPAEPFHYSREHEEYQCEPEVVTEGASSQPGPENEGDSRFIGGTASTSDRTLLREDELPDPEIAVLLEESSKVSSSDDGSSGDESRPRNDTCNLVKNPFVSRADRPENTIAVLVVACWSLRLPVVYMDFINAIESYSLPYLDHVRAFPLSLARHLTKHAIQALSPHYAPKTLSLHRCSARLANQIYDAFNIAIPELNAAPFLWRVVQECFCGTRMHTSLKKWVLPVTKRPLAMLHGLTRKVGKVLSLDLSLQGSAVSSSRGGDRQRHDNVPPEMSFAATAIIVLKLVYGLDGKRRLPRDSDDAACALPTVGEFLAAVEEVDHAESRIGNNCFGSRITLSVGNLDDAVLDEYLDFCQKVLVDPERDEHGVTINFFPLTKGSADYMRGEQLGLRERGFSSARENGPESGALVPGEMYTIYDAKDVLGNLPGDLKMIVERSSRWAGVECDLLCGLVERYERRLLRWWNDMRQGREED